MSDGQLVTSEDLKKVTGYTRIGDIERWLQQENIPFFRGKRGKIFTTIEKLNEALSPGESQPETIEFSHGRKT